MRASSVMGGLAEQMASSSTTMVARASWPKLLLAISPFLLIMALAVTVASGYMRTVVATACGLSVIAVLTVFGRAMVSRRGLMWVADGMLHNALHVSAIPVAAITEVAYRRPDLAWMLYTTFVALIPQGSRPITVRMGSKSYDFPTSMMASPEAVANSLRAMAGLPN
jgi:hypothetical protein